MKLFIFSVVLAFLIAFWIPLPNFPANVDGKLIKCIFHVLTELTFRVGCIFHSLGMTFFGPEHTIRALYGTASKVMGSTTHVDGSVIVEPFQPLSVPAVAFSPKEVDGKPLPTIIYFHGGAWVFGSTQTHFPFLYWLSKTTKSRVINIEYEKSPEVPYDFQLASSIDAVEKILEILNRPGSSKSNVILAGDSSGGNIAASISMLLSRKYTFKGSMLLSPALQAVNFSLPSMKSYRSLHHGSLEYYIALRAGIHPDYNTQAVMYAGNHIPGHLLKRYNEQYLNVLDIKGYKFPETVSKKAIYPTPDSKINSEMLNVITKMATDPKYWPLIAEDEDLRHLPPTFIQACSFDFIRDDALLYAHRLSKLNVPYTLSYVENATHVEPIMSFFSDGSKSQESIEKGLKDIVDFVNSAFTA